MIETGVANIMPHVQKSMSKKKIILYLVKRKSTQGVTNALPENVATNDKYDGIYVYMYNKFLLISFFFSILSGTTWNPPPADNLYGR